MGAIITNLFFSAKFFLRKATTYAEGFVEMVPVSLIVDNSKWFY